MVLTGKTESLRDSHANVKLSTINHTRTGPGFNQAVRSHTSEDVDKDSSPVRNDAFSNYQRHGITSQNCILDETLLLCSCTCVRTEKIVPSASLHFTHIYLQAHYTCL
jgi:hypothetical protein